MKKKKKAIKPKGIDWRKAFRKAVEMENDKDALRAVELIRELYYIVIIKHGKHQK